MKINPLVVEIQAEWSLWQDVEKDNEDRVFIKDHWIHNLSEVVIEGSEIDILEKIKKS